MSPQLLTALALGDAAIWYSDSKGNAGPYCSDCVNAMSSDDDVEFVSLSDAPCVSCITE